MTHRAVFRALCRAAVLLAAAGCGAPDPGIDIPLPDLAVHEPQVVAKIRSAHARAESEGDAAALRIYGRVLYAHEEFDAAERVLLAAAEREGDHRFECLYIAGVAAALRSGPDAAAHVDRALAVRDDYAPARLRAGKLAEQEGRLDVAEAHYVRALELQRSSHGLLGLARIATARGDSAKALRLLRDARALQPRHVEVTALLASTLADLGRAEDARRLAATIPARHPRTHFTDPILLRAAAESVSFRGLVDQARRATQAGEVEDALAYYDQAVAFVPDSTEARMKKGALLAAVARYEEAVATFEEVTRIDPANGVARTRIGRCLDALGHAEEAESALEEGVRISPNRIETRYSLAAFLAARRPAAARELLEEILRESPDQVIARLLLAQILDRAGEHGAARAHIDVILRQQPDHEEALTMRQRLR